MMKYRKKPIVVEAVRWRGDVESHREVEMLTGQNSDAADAACHVMNGVYPIKTLEGTMLAREGDYIVKGVHGECYPCKPDIFEETYEEVDSE